MADIFEVRQQVGTVFKKWLEPIYTGSSERVANDSYEHFVETYPGEYFELVQVTKTERCLKFTPKFDVTPN